MHPCASLGTGACPCVEGALFPEDRGSPQPQELLAEVPQTRTRDVSSIVNTANAASVEEVGTQGGHHGADHTWLPTS